MKRNRISSFNRIRHALEAIQSIEQFTHNYTLEKFLDDEKTISACLYQYSVIGEAVAGIEAVILENHDYPWYIVKSFRNFILHEYHAIEMKVIWDTTIEELPGLKEMLIKILSHEN